MSIVYARALDIFFFEHPNEEAKEPSENTESEADQPTFETDALRNTIGYPGGQTEGAAAEGYYTNLDDGY